MATRLAEPPDVPEEASSAGEPLPRRWTVDEYYRMAEAGVLQPDERVELIEGRILTTGPPRSSHSATIRLVAEALRSVFPRGFDIRQQLPFRIGGMTEPEPDGAVVRGSPRDYEEGHPTSAALIVEVSDTTLVFDRGAKSRLYARARVPEYWVIDLVNRRVEVRRDPARGEAGYRTATLHGMGETVTYQGAPDRPLRVDDLLPRARKRDAR